MTSLTPVQQGMLFHHLMSPDSGVDIEQMICTLHEPVAVRALRTAWQQLTSRHEVFRSRFEWQGLDAPRRIVESEVVLPWTQADWRGLSATARQTQLDTFLAADRARGFNPAEAPLARASLFQLGDDEWVFVWTFHHMLADGQSYVRLINEGFALYDAARGADATPLPPARDFAPFATWLDGRRQKQQPVAEAFWRQALSGIAAPTPLPFRRGESGAATIDPRELTARLSIEDTDRLNVVASSRSVSLNTLVQAAWALVISRASGESDVVFGVTRAGRRDTVEHADEIVGSFINTVPMRATIDPDATVTDWLRALREQARQIGPLEHTALVDVQKWSAVPAGQPLFHSLIVFTPRLIGEVLREQGGAWARREVVFREQTNFPVTLFAYGEPACVLKLAFDGRQISPDVAQRWLAQLETVLVAMAQRPDQRIGALPTVSTLERGLLLDTWNATARPFERTSCVHELIEAQTARTPDAVAVVCRDRSLTYTDLNARANRLAAQLHGLGVRRGDVVGVFVERSLEMVIALIAIHKAGAAYLPLDPSFPQERLSWMVEDTATRVLVTQMTLESRLPRHNASVVIVDLATPAGAAAPPNPSSGVTADDLAYVIFTSGSTGRPKGVMVRHRNVTNFFAGMDDSLEFTAPGTWLAVTSISFDISVLELFWTLSRGFTVVLQEDMETAAAATIGRDRPMGFGLFYFSADAREDGGNRYRLLFEGAKYADAHGFTAVWTPERHFHEFGGLYPNPAVTSAALAALTSRLQIRAGSVVLPLHNPIRVAEDWAVVDNIANGRVEISVASGWHVNDFALMPEAYEDRREIMARGIETIRRLWRGESVPATNGRGQPIDVRIYPAPRQTEPPVWIAAAGSPDTFTMAGRIGARLLTNLLGQKVEEVAKKLQLYREAWKAAGHPGEGRVALMLHTFVGPDLDTVRETVRKPLIEYLKTSTELVKQARWEFPAFATPGKQKGPIDNSDLTDAEVDAMMEHAFERYFQTSGLFGTPESCLPMVNRLKAIGVDEIACLLDFGIATDTVLANLPHLNELRERSQAVTTAPVDDSIPAQIERHAITHLQGTPSLMRTILADPRGPDGLGRLHKLLVGGEPLPPALAGALLQSVKGDLLNMYGPTETTVWSSVARITDAADVTIGRPIANTQLYIVDRHGQPTPIGAAGELLIGGDGVTRGYWNRPDLTAERFIQNPCVATPDVVYRTGDLARYRDDGRIEFLGRLDHQVKLHGHRIELGEIEARLGSHAAVAQSVVDVRIDGGGEPRLVAYVVAKPDAPTSAATTWQSVWDDTYRHLAEQQPVVDPTFDISGWRSSFTGELIAESDMREWVDHTVDRILALKPSRVLEIGCGTGLLLYRVAPRVDHYTGIDFSAAAIARLRHDTAARGLTNVDVREGTADRLTRQPDLLPVDVVVINSVAQYFPDIEYLIRVIEQAVSRVKPGGAIFLGDIRSLPLLEAFHMAVALTQAPADMPARELRHRVRDRINHDAELVIAPAFFDALRSKVPSITHVTTQLKRGRGDNELVRFRCDVVLRVGGGGAPKPDAERSGASATLDAIRQVVPEGTGIRVRGLVNPRIVREIEAARLLASETCPDTVGDLRQVLDRGRSGVEPEDAIGAAAGWDVELSFTPDGAPDRYDVIVRAKDARRSVDADPMPSTVRPWHEYVHQGRGDTGHLVQALKEHLRAELPPYMLPGAFVVLDALPLTPNGKVDRKALPEPDRQRQEVAAQYVAPADDVERLIAETWQDLLALERVSTHDNFFDIGANSLLMVQAHSALRQKLGRPLSLVDLFRFPTVQTLAAHLNQTGEPADSAVLAASEARAHSRVDALSKRRQARQAGRPVTPVEGR
ncbi:MAG: MupA/Atu3671 family FMN-dependent luciferase-like monooxygenase [Acidobacteriota bacterium]